MLQVTVSGNNRDELVSNLTAMVEAIAGRGVAVPMATPTATAEEAVTEKKRGRPKKEAEQCALPAEATVAPSTASSVPVLDSTPAAAGPVTFEQVKAALQGVAAQRPGDTTVTDGYKRVADILTRYGYKTVKEMKPEHFEAILGDCKK